MRHLILGGARSGKSRYAEQLAHANGLPVSVIVTAQAHDAEMTYALPTIKLSVLLTGRSSNRLSISLIPCKPARKTGIASSSIASRYGLPIYYAKHPSNFRTKKNALIAILPTLPGTVLLVSNELGSGIVPLGELTRQFVDEAGWLNQAVPGVCERVTLVVAEPLELKPQHN